MESEETSCKIRVSNVPVKKLFEFRTIGDTSLNPTEIGKGEAYAACHPRTWSLGQTAMLLGLSLVVGLIYRIAGIYEYKFLYL